MKTKTRKLISHEYTITAWTCNPREEIILTIKPNQWQPCKILNSNNDYTAMGTITDIKYSDGQSISDIYDYSLGYLARGEHINYTVGLTGVKQYYFKEH